MFQKLAMQSATPLKKLKTSCKQFTNKKLAPMMASFLRFKIINHTYASSQKLTYQMIDITKTQLCRRNQQRIKYH